MHPTDHISTALVYFDDPRRISGALYHLVATYYVIIGSWTDWLTVAIDLANPKSANLAKQSESSKIFEGLRSRWMSSPECMNFIAFRTLNKGGVTDRGHISYGHFPWY